MNSTKLVSIGVQEVAKVHRSIIVLSKTWRVFNAGSPVRDSDVMKLLYLFGRIAYESYGGAV